MNQNFWPFYLVILALAGPALWYNIWFYLTSRNQPRSLPLQLSSVVLFSLAALVALLANNSDSTFGPVLLGLIIGAVISLADLFWSRYQNR